MALNQCICTDVTNLIWSIDLFYCVIEEKERRHRRDDDDERRGHRGDEVSSYVT